MLSSSAAVKSAKSFKTALEEEKIRVNDKLWEFTNRGGGNSFSKKVEKSLEDFSEAAIVVIGRSGSDTDLNEPAYGGPKERSAEEVERRRDRQEDRKADAENEEDRREDERRTRRPRRTARMLKITGAKALQLTKDEEGTLSPTSRSTLTA